MNVLKVLIGLALAVFIVYWLILYPFFIYPVRVASQPTNSVSELILGGLVLIYLLVGAIEHVMTIAANLYGFKKYRLFAWFFPANSFFYKAQIAGEQGFAGTNRAIGGSYLFIVFLFTLSYLYLGIHFPGMFDAKSVTFWDALYLSFTAISVGPAGLNPTSPVAKCFVMVEVAVGLFYTVLVFSVLADWIRRRNESAT